MFLWSNKTLTMKTRIFSVLAASLLFGFAACNSDENTAATDTANDTENTTATTTTSTGSYAAQADSFRINSEAGAYRDARTGKQIRINVDPETGRRTNAETGEPVWRYVDTRTWWVYGGDNWEPTGEAKMENDQLMYRDESNNWVPYEKRWKTEDEKLKSDWEVKHDDDGDFKMKNDEKDAKIKIDKDGDMKIKTKDGKTKYDADDGEVKKKD